MRDPQRMKGTNCLQLKVTSHIPVNSLLSSGAYVWLQVLLLRHQFSQNLCSPSTCPKARHLYWNVTWVVLHCQTSAGSRTESNLETTQYVQRWVIWLASPLLGLVACGLNTPASMCAKQQMSLASHRHLLPSVSSVSDFVVNLFWCWKLLYNC